MLQPGRPVARAAQGGDRCCCAEVRFESAGASGSALRDRNYGGCIRRSRRTRAQPNRKLQAGKARFGAANGPLELALSWTLPSQTSVPVRAWLRMEPVSQAIQMPGKNARSRAGLAANFRNDDAIRISDGVANFGVDAVDQFFQAAAKLAFS